MKIYHLERKVRSDPGHSKVKSSLLPVIRVNLVVRVDGHHNTDFEDVSIMPLDGTVILRGPRHF